MRLLAQHTRAGHVPSHVSSSGFDHGCGASMLRLAIARTEIGAPLAQSVSFARLRVGIWHRTHALVMYQVMYETSLRPTTLGEAQSGVRLVVHGEAGGAGSPLDPSSCGIWCIRTSQPRQGGWGTTAGHVRTPTDRASHATAKSMCSTNDRTRPPTHQSHLWASLSALCRPARDPSGAD